MGLVGSLLGGVRAVAGWVNRAADRVVASTYARTCRIDDVPEGHEVWIRGRIEASNPVLAAPLYHRWYRHTRRAGGDDRDVTPTYGPPAPEAAWSGGNPDLHPLSGPTVDERIAS